MLRKKWTTPKMTILQMNSDELGDISQLSDAEVAIRMEEAGYQFKKKYKASENYIHRKIADSDVLISVGSNIGDSNESIQLKGCMISLWEQLAEPSTIDQLENVLEDTYGVSHEQAVKDVIDFLNDLEDHDMVTVQ